MEATTTKKTDNLIIRLLQFKREMRECIQNGADPDEMKRIADKYGFTFATPIWGSEDAMIMVCDSTDGKQHRRRNLFDRWFHYYNDGTLTAINAEVGEGDYELLLSIYFKKDNPYKQQLIKAFGDLLAQDLYDIVI